MNELLVMAIIGGRRCALHANDVQSVIELGTVTPVPQTPTHIAGITALRSRALTVIDCRSAIGLDSSAFATDSRAAAVTILGHSYALVVDQIEDIATAVTESGEVVGGFGEEWTRVATGIVETTIGPALLIDLPALIAGPETIASAA